MAFKIFDNKPMKHALEKALSVLHTPSEQEQDIAIINVQYRPSGNEALHTNPGLVTALAEAKSGKPIILHSFLNEENLMKDRRFVVLINLGNVAFLRDPFLLADLITKASELVKTEQIKDPLGFALFDLEHTKDVMRILAHDLRYAKQNETRMITWLERARSEGLEGTDEEIIKSVDDWDAGLPQPFKGQFFPGVFVDIEGTFLDKDNRLNQIVKSMTEELAVGKPITLWTGGDVDELEKKIRELGIKWKVVSKDMLVGAEVEEAIDDLPLAEFEEQYKIKCLKYHQI